MDTVKTFGTFVFKVLIAFVVINLAIGIVKMFVPSIGSKVAGFILNPLGMFVSAPAAAS